MKTLRFHVSVAVVAFALAGAGASEAEAQPAQSSASSSSALDDKARELFRDGVKAAEKSQWTKAHASFLAAWSLKQHYQILGNLGTSEAMLGKWRDAAEHLSRYLREAPKEKVEERKSAEDLLAQARRKVGAITVRVEPAGAEVFVDEVSIGKAPFVNEVFVNPGARVIEARLDGYEVAKAKVDAAAGTSREVALTLVKSASAVGRGATGSGSSASADRANANGGAAVKDGPRKEVIITGIVVSALAAGTGIAFAVVSAGKASDADEKLTSLRQQIGDPNPCWPGQQAAGCDEVRGFIEGREVFGNLALWSIVAGTAVGAGTAVYAWMASKPSITKSSAMAKDVAVMPFVTNSAAGVAIRGAW